MFFTLQFNSKLLIYNYTTSYEPVYGFEPYKYKYKFMLFAQTFFYLGVSLILINPGLVPQPEPKIYNYMPNLNNKWI
jgi:hypothetical protein